LPFVTTSGQQRTMRVAHRALRPEKAIPRETIAL
jgi:hypothetical protein